MPEHYFGSVRFFKNLILLAVIAGIAVPSGLALRYRRQLETLPAAADALTEQVAQAESGLAQAQQLYQQAQSDAEARQLAAEEAAALETAMDSYETDAPAYEALYPDFYAPEPLSADQVADKTIYLTFDDGPSARTAEILDILEQEDAKATFFVIGRTDEQSRQLMQRIVADGHTLAMHSYSHNYEQIYASVDAYLADMYQLFTLLREVTGETPSCFRFPGGSINGYNHGVYQEILTEMLRRGFVPFDWNLSSGDATGAAITKSKILNNVVAKSAAVNRGIVLMHDAAPKTTTVSALPEMIAGLRKNGFELDRLTAQVKPVLYGYAE